MNVAIFAIAGVLAFVPNEHDESPTRNWNRIQLERPSSAHSWEEQEFVSMPDSADEFDPYHLAYYVPTTIDGD